MARLTVPNALIPQLSKLASLTEASAAELFSAIDSAPALLNPKIMASKIAAQTPSIPQEDLSGILEALFSVSAAQVATSVPVSKFVDDVAESLSEKKAKLDVDKLKPKLEKLLRLRALSLAVKASTLQRDHASLFLNARIFTDVRPVFAEAPETVETAVVFHSLKLTYLQSSEPQEFFLAMDDDDLAALQKVIARAEKKSKAIRTFLGKSGLPNVDPIGE